MITILVASLTEPTEDSVLTDVFRNDTSSLFIMILAIVGITGEWRHRTITSSLLAAPDRIRFLAAKTLAFAAAGALLSIAISISIGIIGYAILEFRDLPTPELGELIEQFARNAGVAALLGRVRGRHRQPDPEPADRDRHDPDLRVRGRPDAGQRSRPAVERFSPTRRAAQRDPGPRSRRRRHSPTSSSSPSAQQLP